VTFLTLNFPRTLLRFAFRNQNETSVGTTRVFLSA